jgi:hypothetical protein
VTSEENPPMPGDDILSLAPPPADERVPYGSDAHQFGDLRLPKGNGPHPVVMNIHGGFWRNECDLTQAGHHSREVEGECLARTEPRRGSECHLRPWSTVSRN